MAVRPLRGSKQREESSMSGRPRRRLYSGYMSGVYDPPLLTLLKTLSDAAAFDDGSSAQYKAYDWLFYTDTIEFDLDLDDDGERLLERYAAVVLYFATGKNIPGWLVADKDFCIWSGIDCYSCDDDDCVYDRRVKSVELIDNNLVGTIPLAGSDGEKSNNLVGNITMEVKAWEYLEDFKIDIDLKGPIPTEVWDMESLEVFEWSGIDLIPYSPSLLKGVNMSPIFVLSGAEALANQDSPQHKALDWLVQTDKINLAGLTEEELLERYAAVVLYFATGGELPVGSGTWNEATFFLEPDKHVCRWEKTGFDVEGTLCNNNDRVESVILLENNLVGNIPMEVKAWEHLKDFKIDIDLKGPIPMEVWDMDSLAVFEWSGIDLIPYSPSLLKGVNMSPIFVLSGAEALSDEETPQHKALDWLVQTADEFNLAGSLAEEKLLQRYAAVVLFFATGENIPGWLIEGKSICDWSGVHCYSNKLPPHNVRVKSVELTSAILTSAIPMEVSAWKYLANLEIDNIQLDGPIPKEVWNMNSNRFKTLKLNGVNYIPLRDFSGEAALTNQNSPQYKAFDWLVNTDEFEIVPADGIGFDELLLERYAAAVLYYATGGESPVIGAWTKKLGFLGPEEPSICDWHTNTPAMMGIFCDDNDLVRSVALFENNLDGTIPMEISAWSQMTNLALRDNGPALSGPVPTEIGKLEKLKWLNFRNNSLTGTIPSEIGLLTNLQGLRLQGNNLDIDMIPANITALDLGTGFSYSPQNPEAE